MGYCTVLYLIFQFSTVVRFSHVRTNANLKIRGKIYFTDRETELSLNIQ